MNACAKIFGLPVATVILIFLGQLRCVCDGRPGPLCDHGHIYSLATSPSGNFLAVVGRYGRSHDGRLSLYDTKTGEETAARLWPKGNLVTVALDLSGKRLVVGDEAGQITVWQLQESAETEEERLKLVNQITAPARANDLLFSPDGSLLALACADHVVRLLDLATSTVVAELRGHTGGVSAVAFSPNGRRIASAGGSDGTIKVWEVAQGTSLLTLEHGVASATDVTFSPDGKWIVGSYGDSYYPAPQPWVAMEYPQEQVRIWDALSGELIRSFHVGGDRVTSVAFGPRGRRIAAGYTWKKATSGDNSVAIIGVGRGERQCTLRGLWRAPLVRWCENRDYIAVVSGRNITFWNLAKPADPQKLWKKQWRWADKVSLVSPLGGSGSP